MEERVDFRTLAMIATVMDICTGTADRRRRGRPPAATIRVLASLRQFLREGTPWRSLTASTGKASGSTLRRRLREWAEGNLLQQAHAVLVAMLRGHPDLILDSCCVRAKRGTKYHVAVTGDGVPVACAATAANVNDTLLFERLFLAAFAVLARIRTVFADKGDDAKANHDLCRAFGVEPCLHQRQRPRGSGLGKKRWPVERSNAWILDNRRLALRYDRLGFIIQSLLQAACLFLVAGRLAREF
jgi:transposase